MNSQTTRQPTPEQTAACACLIWEEEGWPPGRPEAQRFQVEKRTQPNGIAGAAMLAEPPVTELSRLKHRNNFKRREVVAR